MNPQNRINFKFYIKTLGLIFPEYINSIEKISSSWLKSAEKWIKSEGVDNGLARIKAVHSATVRAILHCTHDRPDAWVNCRKNGIPRIVAFNSHLAFKDRRFAVALLSVTSAYLCFTLDTKVDYSSITSNYTGKDLSVLRFKIADQVRFLRLPDYKDSCGLGWFLSSKAGPNGSPSWLKWSDDLYALYHHSPHLFKDIVFLSQFFKQRVRMREITGLPSLFRFPLSKIWSHSFKVWRHKDTLNHSKLHIIKQPGGKNRIIAIGDVLSQTVLNPIHTHLMKCLRTIPQDGTFDQNAQVERIKKWVRADRNVYSYDLKSCTDRFPIAFQRIIIDSLYGKEVGNAWVSIMTDRAFMCKLSNSAYRYTVGQPMGLLSSWAAMALSHHVVVRLCASELGIPEANFCSLEYSILGDDIVIGDESLANAYKTFVTETLGIKISLSKSIITTGGFEFAKRLVRYGTEFSPIPSNLVMQIRKFPNLIALLNSTLNERWSIKPDLRLLTQLLPKKERMNGLKLLTCPLWSSELIKSESLWRVSQASLWVLCKQFSLDKENVDKKLERIQTFFDNIEKSNPINTVKWTNPITAKRSTFVHRLHLGTRERDPTLFAGNGFMMHNLTSSVDGVILKPDDLFVDLSFKEDFGELEIRKALQLSRSLKKAMNTKQVGDINYYLFHCLYIH